MDTCSISNTIDTTSDTKDNSNHIVYTYAILLTPKGKGYACFAIEPTEDEDGKAVKVASAFCSPNDIKKFSKSLARKMAFCRLNASRCYKYRITNPDDGNEFFKQVITEYLGFDTTIPKWAKISIKNNAWLHTLKYDRFSYRELLQILFTETADLLAFIKIK